MKRILSVLLTFTLLMGTLPGAVFATEECTHEDYYIKRQMAASCGASGFIQYQCNVCAMRWMETIAATGEHSYENGICLECGAAAPEPSVPEITIVDSGVCGENLTWTLDSEGTLTISGTGAMQNWDGYYDEYNSRPSWCSLNPVKNVIIEPGVTTIGSFAFGLCEDLQSVTIPDSVTKIGSYAFDCCTNLQSVILPDSITVLNESTFANCSSLTSITIPDSVISIGFGAFSGCSNLQDVTIGNSVTYIGGWAFSDCSNLQNIALPASLTEIGYNLFSGCSSLTGIWVDPENPNYSSDASGAFFNKDKSTLIAVPKVASHYTIPEGTTRIEEYAFYEYAALQSVTIPNSVTYIGDWAFYKCSNLQSVTIPANVTDISDYAFHSCQSLQSVSIGPGVTYIGDWAFENCHSIQNVYYSGTEAQWAQIAIQAYNEFLLNAEIIYLGVEPEPDEPEVFTTATIDFSTTAQRVFLDTNAQVWQNAGVTLTNSKANSITNVADYCNPARFYRDSMLTIETKGMTKIVFSCISAHEKYVANLENSLAAIEGITYTSDNKIITIELAEPTNCFSFPLTGGQIRVNEISVDLVMDSATEIKGDINGDEQITNDDVVALMWHVVFPEENPISAEADFTGDGEVTNDDVIHLMWHILFPDEKPL